MTTDGSTKVEATTGSTLLRDIAAAIEAPGSSRTISLTRFAVGLFAKVNGWRWDPAYRFSPEYLGRYGNDENYQRPFWRDHALYFRGRMEGKQGWVNIAIVGQPYAGADCRTELEELNHNGYRIHTPPSGEKMSIWYPGHTRFLVVTLPGVKVRWLPEQE